MDSFYEEYETELMQISSLVLLILHQAEWLWYATNSVQSLNTDTFLVDTLGRSLDTWSDKSAAAALRSGGIYI